MPTIKQILYLDFETYYDAKRPAPPTPAYSLRDMTPPEYILDSRFEVIMCAVAFNSEPSRIVDGCDFGDFIKSIDPAVTATVTYNALFDNSILAWKYNFVPARMYDSMNMARALRGWMLPNLKLATVAPLLLGTQKGDTLLKVSGMRRDGIYNRPGLWQEMREYCMQDNDNSRGIFKLLFPEFPASEQKIMDLVIRCAVEPKFVLDKELLVKHLDKLKTDKEKLLTDSGLDKKTIMSTAKFADVLKGMGVEVETKPSPATGLPIPALSKTDKFMQDLLEHDNPVIQTVAAARLGLKSTIEETRCEKFLRLANVTPRMPVPLRYAGAHTHRLSGDWGLNLQNLPRGSTLRRCLIAPTGSVVVAADLAQIEARIAAWIAGEKELLSAFSVRGKSGDPYRLFASIIFNKPLHLINTVERFIGKTAVLGLGYGCGWNKFYNMVKTSARIAGIDISGVFDEKFAKMVVSTYRQKYSRIPATWRLLQQHLRNFWSIGTARTVLKAVDIGRELVEINSEEYQRGTIYGPTGLDMYYDRPTHEDNGYIFWRESNRYPMHGAKFLENIVQFLARLVVMHVALRLDTRGYRFCLQAHDELVFIVPEGDAEQAKEVIYEEMTRPPKWAPDLPLDAEVKSGRSYGECK